MVYGEIYGPLEEMLFSFHYSFFLSHVSARVVQILSSLTWIGVTHTIHKNRIYDPAILPLILKGYIHYSQAMVWTKEHMFNLLLLRYYIPFPLWILPSLFLYLSMKMITKFPAFFKLIIQNFLHLEAKVALKTEIPNCKPWTQKI